MKHCQVCLNDVDDAAPTCPFCGEASWAIVAPAVDPAADSEPAPESPVSDDPTDVTTADASPAAKRGRRK